MSQSVAARLDEAFAGVRDDLARLVAIPSVSLHGFDGDAVRRSAGLTASLLAAAGAREVELLSAGDGQPAVYARWPAPPGAPTVLLYAHHDVQPAGDAGAWTTAPFEARERDSRLYGRGAADNKAGIAVHLAALRAHGGRPPVGVVALVEGEEEIGSPTLGALLDEHALRLRSDVVVVADSALLRVGQPALTISLRGLVDCVVELRTLAGALHSGVFGGVVPDALSALAGLLATLHRPDGAVAVAGVEGVVPRGLALEGGALIRNAAAVPGVRVPDEAEAALRAWARPAVSVLAVDAPAVEGAGNQLAPAARAKVSLRLPPGVDALAALAALERHLVDHAPWGAQVGVSPGQRAQPVLADTGRPAFRVAEGAFADAWGVAPIRIGSGGTIPAAAALAARFPDAALVVFGAADRTSRTHAPDESVDLGELRRCALAEALLLERLAQPG